MTTECAFVFSRHELPEVCIFVCPPCSEGAGKTGCLLHPRSRVRFALKKMHTSIQGSWNTPAFPAQWLYGLLRALPGERLFCHRRPREAWPPTDLMPAPRHQDHTTSPYASRTLACARFASIASHRTFVTIASAPQLGETGGVMRLIWPAAEAEYFCASGWTTQINLIRLGKLAFWCSALTTSSRAMMCNYAPENDEQSCAFIRIAVTRGANFSAPLPNRFSSGVVGLLCEPFRLCPPSMGSTRSLSSLRERNSARRRARRPYDIHCLIHRNVTAPPFARIDTN
jgi:hypothetical protein